MLLHALFSTCTLAHFPLQCTHEIFLLQMLILCAVQCVVLMCMMQITLCSVQCAAYGVHCALTRIYCSVCSVQCALFPATSWHMVTWPPECNTPIPSPPSLPPSLPPSPVALKLCIGLLYYNNNIILNNKLSWVNYIFIIDFYCVLNHNTL